MGRRVLVQRCQFGIDTGGSHRMSVTVAQQHEARRQGSFAATSSPMLAPCPRLLGVSDSQCRDVSDVAVKVHDPGLPHHVAST
ncbi:hypothetical protein A5765_01560 [Mycolicibacterium celeriflavum]|nr:hypothetical protein A5765_01560 [Mycolicibacterium celeriflavum]